MCTQRLLFFRLGNPAVQTGIFGWLALGWCCALPPSWGLPRILNQERLCQPFGLPLHSAGAPHTTRLYMGTPEQQQQQPGDRTPTPSPTPKPGPACLASAHPHGLVRHTCALGRFDVHNWLPDRRCLPPMALDMQVFWLSTLLCHRKCNHPLRRDGGCI